MAFQRLTITYDQEFEYIIFDEEKYFNYKRIL